MLEIIKYGTSKYGVWVLGHLEFDSSDYGSIDIVDIFSTNLEDEEYFKDKTSVIPKMFKITRNRNKQLVFKLEF